MIRTSVLSKEQIDKIHEKSMMILEEIGVTVPHPELLSRFAAKNAKVDHRLQTVKIPPSLVEESLALAGKSYCIYGRDMKHKAEFGRGKRNYNSIAGEALWLDELRGERRYPVLADVANATRLADALPNITIPGAMADPVELPISWRCVAVAAEMLRNTEKPVTFWFHDRASAKFLVDMAIMLRGNAKDAEKYPPFYPFFEPISPLRFPFNGIDLLFESARINLPVPIGPMAQMGLSAPCSIAGTMAQENAEILAGICITQLIREGMPVCYGGICHGFDMKTSQMIFGGPEQVIFSAGMTQMGKHYGLPVYVNAGLTDSKLPDGQAGMEIAMTLGSACAAGADIFGHMGICGVDQATSLDMLVFQNEVISYVESVCREIDLSDEIFGIGTLKDVVNNGSFIDQEHTAENFRKEYWFPALSDRDYFQQWFDSGRKDIAQKCQERKNELLRNHRPAEPSDELKKSLHNIVNSARKELEGK